MATIRPFDFDGNYTSMHNYMYDVALRTLSSKAWAALSFIVRQTKGWRCEEKGLSYTDIMQGANIKSSATVSRVLQELLGCQYIEALRTNDVWGPTHYRLNTELEINTDYKPGDYEIKLSTSKIKADDNTPTSKIKAVPTSKIEEIYIEGRKGRKDSCVADFPQAPAQAILFETPAEPTVSKAKPGPKPKSERTPEYEAYLARKKSIEQAYIELIGYTPTSFGEVARASKQLATAYYDASHLRGCWQHMMQNKFWSEKHASGEHIKLTSIANELPAWWSVEQARIAARKANEERLMQEQQQRRQVNEKILSPEERVAFVRKLRQEQRAFTQNATP